VAGPRLIPKRRWPRRVLVAANVVVVMVLIASGAVWGYVHYQLDSIHTVAAPHLTQTVRVPAQTSDGLAPENILLIGNETRAGLTNPSEMQQFGSPQQLSGSLSDVIMVLHLNPKTDTASLLSIPRDVFVPMPAGSEVGPYEKIDAALNDGTNGPDNLIQAITDDFGIPINHFIELTFDGMQGVVNSLGGIKLDFPERLYDQQSDLDITTTGCQQINGTEALALVRSRHLQYDPPGDNAPPADWPYDPESDLARIARDHTFLRVLASTGIAEGFTNPIKANDFIGAVINDIVIDPGLRGQLLSLATHYRKVNPAAVPELTLPITTVNSYTYAGSDIGDVDFPVQPLDNQVIAQWDGSALPTPAAPTAVPVYNLAGTPQLATTTTAALRADGLNASIGGDQPVPGSPTETLLNYPPASLAQALDVLDHLSGAVMLQVNPSLPAGTVQVDAGSLLSVSAPAAPTPVTPATATATATAPVSQPTTAAAAGGVATTAPTVPSGTSPTSTALPTPNGETPSSSSDQLQPWDPIACAANPSAAAS
jgi:LCP family protein required for cell wall assembly